MKNSSHQKERRDHPRILMNLPVNFEIKENGGGYPGLTIDASQSGLLIQTLKEMPVGIRLNIEVLFPKELNLPTFRAETEVIWKDISYWEDWEGYQYGLKVTNISNEDYRKLSYILSNPSCLQEVYFAEDPDHDPTLIVKTQ
jgi:hypothetical protein